MELELETFFEKPFWEVEYKELLQIFRLQKSLPLGERDPSILEDVQSLRTLINKKFGSYENVEKALFKKIN